MTSVGAPNKSRWPRGMAGSMELYFMSEHPNVSVKGIHSDSMLPIYPSLA
jgi:hypothetical protein